MKTLRIIEIGILSFVGLLNLSPIFDFNSGKIPNNIQLDWATILVIVPIVILIVMGVTYLFIRGKIIDPEIDIRIPKLGNNPFKRNASLDRIYVGALFFLVSGSCMLITYLIKNGEVFQMGILAIAYGLGLLGTIKISLLKREQIKKVHNNGEHS